MNVRNDATNGSNFWAICGQVGKIEKFNNCYMISLADNRYKRSKETGEYEKYETVWIKVLTTYKPNFKIGDQVLANGTFEASKNPRFSFVLKATHIFVKPKENEDVPMQEES